MLAFQLLAIGVFHEELPLRYPYQRSLLLRGKIPFPSRDGSPDMGIIRSFRSPSTRPSLDPFSKRMRLQCVRSSRSAGGGGSMKNALPVMGGYESFRLIPH